MGRSTWVRNRTLRSHHPDVFAEVLDKIHPDYRHWAADIIWFEQSNTESRKGYEQEWHDFHLKWDTLDSWSELDQERLQREFDNAGYKIKIGNKTDHHHTRVTKDGIAVGGRHK